METIIFVLISIGIIVIPGPNVLVIISTSINHGKVRGLQTVAGTSSAMLVQLFIAAVGTTWFISTLAEGFIWLKWFGVAYLLYLGISNILGAYKVKTENVSAIGSFHRGFWVSLTNPKTILFFSAFLPQFVSDQQSYYAQIMYLSLLFWLLAIALDATYALLASRLTNLLKNGGNAKYQKYLSGILYIGAGSALAVAKNG